MRLSKFLLGLRGLPGLAAFGPLYRYFGLSTVPLCPIEAYVTHYCPEPGDRLGFLLETIVISAADGFTLSPTLPKHFVSGVARVRTILAKLERRNPDLRRWRAEKQSWPRPEALDLDQVWSTAGS